MRFAICNEIYGNWGIEDLCKDAAAAGYQGLEIAPFTLANYGLNVNNLDHAKQLGENIRSHGLDPLGLHWLLAQTQDYHLTCPDDQINQRAADYLITLAKFCAAMGGKIMILGSPKQRDISAGQSYEDAFGRAVRICRRVCEVAGELGVTLAIEPLGEIETNFLTTAEETINFIEAVNHSACTLHLDVKAMSSEDKPIPQIIEDSKKHLSHFHANDPNLRGPGQGIVNFQPILQKLFDINYSGYISVEVFDFTPGPTTIAKQSIKYMREIVENIKSVSEKS